MADEQESFGQRMVRLKREQGIPVAGPGRTPHRQKYHGQIEQAERVFARALPSIAQEFVDELRAKEPEQCPQHRLVLCCTECGYASQRSVFDHKAAAYAADRIMGKPTTRSEQTFTLRFVEQVSAAFLAVFTEVNELESPIARRQAFANGCAQLRAQIGGDGVSATD